jgi:ribokinase
MRGENLRAGAISLGAGGSLAFTVDEQWQAAAFGVPVVDTTGAGDAFAGGVAVGLACRWPWPAILRFANAVAGLATTALGAQTALPNWDTVTALIAAQATMS